MLRFIFLLCVITYYVGAFTDGRLTISVTKFDDNYEKHTKQNQTRRTRHKGEKIVTADDAISKVIKDVKDSTNMEISRSTVVPLSGKWALTCSMLKNCQIQDPDNQHDLLHSDALQALKLYPHLSLSGGEGQLHDQILEGSSEASIISMLEDASGITALKER